MYEILFGFTFLFILITASIIIVGYTIDAYLTFVGDKEFHEGWGIYYGKLLDKLDIDMHDFTPTYALFLLIIGVALGVLVAFLWPLFWSLLTLYVVARMHRFISRLNKKVNSLSPEQKQ